MPVDLVEPVSYSNVVLVLCILWLIIMVYHVLGCSSRIEFRANSCCQ
uniref:Uncharacterized protein n=1 Tax=Amphimedon queenslandica TaxID=400682 RepID=A0A1X7T5Y8_AMPQE